MATLKPNLLVVAHPDDESIFFAGLIQRERRRPWHLVCVTDGNGDGRGAQRHSELMRAARALKIKRVEQWDFPDRFNQRLAGPELIKRLAAESTPYAVYTHSIIGDYGHPHHQDVSWAVHRAFAKRTPVWSVAYNAFPKMVIELRPKEFKIKAKILSQIYHLETERFVHLLPAGWSEGFVRVSLKEIEHLYTVLRDKKPVSPSQLKVYRWLASQIPKSAYGGMERPF